MTSPYCSYFRILLHVKKRPQLPSLPVINLGARVFYTQRWILKMWDVPKQRPTTVLFHFVQGWEDELSVQASKSMSSSSSPPVPEASPPTRPPRLLAWTGNLLRATARRANHDGEQLEGQQLPWIHATPSPPPDHAGSLDHCPASESKPQGFFARSRRLQTEIQRRVDSGLALILRTAQGEIKKGARI